LWLQRTTDFARRDETRQRLTEQERQERNQQLQKTLTLLVHACSCHDPQCSSTSCRKVRQHSPCVLQPVTSSGAVCGPLRPSRDLKEAFQFQKASGEVVAPMTASRIEFDQL
jgi:hypothetical protein